jgi:hypothetical protein
MPVEIKGLAETITAMRKFEPDLAKNLNKEARAAMTPIQKEAKSFVPSTVPGLSNWMLATSKKKITKQTSAFRKGTFPRFNASLVRRGIKVYIGKTTPNRNGFVTFYQLTNNSAAGAIMETAGRLNPSGRKTSHEVTINKRFKPTNITVRTSHDSGSNNPDAGMHFINSMGGQMKGKDKLRGRLIYRANEEDHGRTVGRLVKAVQKTVVQFHARADAQVFRNVA